MEIQKYLDEMRNVQINILDFLDDEYNVEENFQNLQSLFDDIEIHKNFHKLKSLLHLLLNISNNIHRSVSFINKIERILQLLKDDIKNNFSNIEIFKLFISNRKILLLLFQENLLIVDKSILHLILTYGYFDYFIPEISLIKDEEWFQKYLTKYYLGIEEMPEDFYEKRKEGENDDYICQLIRKDLIEEFIIYVNKELYPLNSMIYRSNYETNSFLLNKFRFTLIEYAAFCGSIQIFNYLRLNNVELTPYLWYYAIHGRCEEMIHILEENNIWPKENIKEFYVDIYIESIKCHHNEFANYIIDNYLQNEKEELHDSLKTCLKFYNFAFIPNNSIDGSLFYYLCKYDYYIIVNTLLNKVDVDINQIIIFLISL